MLATINQYVEWNMWIQNLPISGGMHINHINLYVFLVFWLCHRCWCWWCCKKSDTIGSFFFHCIFFCLCSLLKWLPLQTINWITYSNQNMNNSYVFGTMLDVIYWHLLWHISFLLMNKAIVNLFVFQSKNIHPNFYIFCNIKDLWLVLIDVVWI